MKNNQYIMCEKANDIINAIASKINKKQWEGLVELFDLVDETTIQNPQIIAKKYFWLGRFYKEKHKDLKQAKEFFSKVLFDSDEITFYISKLYIALCLVDDEEYEEALSYLNEVQQCNNLQVEIHARSVLSNLYWKQEDKKEEAIQLWLSTPKNYPKLYNKSQSHLLFKASFYYMETQQNENLENILEKIELPELQYDIRLLNRIIECGDDLQEAILKVYRNVEQIKKSLQIKNTKKIDIYDFCNKFAHYTTSNIAKKILGTTDNCGSLQLSVADLMNDPTEGKILHEILGQPNWLTNRFNHRYYQAYASCFSFNHDSLNQFRLYGKESGKEATGISMIFNMNMFSQDEFSNNINPSDGLVQKGSNQSNLPTKLPLYQCIYYDPKSEYYKLASRSEITFYRQGEINGDTTEKIQEKWNEYSWLVAEKEVTVRELFVQLKIGVNSVHECIEKLLVGHNQKKHKVISLVNDILLPIQFLVKHAAFIEEDECRMIYIVGAGSDEIKEMKLSENQSRLYIDYEPSVVEHLDKIYLSDGAKEERAFLERAWQKALDRDGITDKSIDIRDSDNPFRI